LTANQPLTRPAPGHAVDPEALQELLGQVIADAGGALILPLALLGDRLGLFSALASGGPATAGELAQRTGLTERYLREWLLAMAAAGYVTYAGSDANGGHPAAARYRLSPEQAEAFTNPDSPGYVAGAFQNLTAATRALDRLTEAFRTGAGIGWHEHHQDMFEGTERFFRPGYLANLTSSWIPSLTGAGTRLADGARAAAAGVADRATFRVAGAADLTGSYDLITFFDCLHDMPDPEGALRAARAAIADGGTVMLVEPMSWDSIEETFNPLGKLLAAASTLICLPSGLSAAPARGLGNQAGPAATRELARDAGFSDTRIAATTDFNLIYELRP
jgi:hypothetical protein